KPKHTTQEAPMALVSPIEERMRQPPALQHKRKKVLFWSGGDGSRCLMAQALMRQLAGQKYDVASACRHPANHTHPSIASTLALTGVSSDNLVANDVDAFAGDSFDYVIALCDHVHESCPTLPGPETIHWTFPDPAEIGDEARQDRAFHDVFQGLA